jgi:cytochrome c556
MTLLRVASVLLALAVSGCTDERGTAEDTVRASEGAPASSPQTLPLKEIMAGLENDLADVAAGFWIEDTERIASAAQRIAEHPRVPPEQMGRIQLALTDEFPAFAQMDGRVHNAAVALADAAEASRSMSELFERFIEIQTGCIACHATFRTRVAEALGDGVGP